MKAEELMIRDFVRIHCFDDSEIIIRITEIHNRSVYGESDTGNHWADYKNIKPIPLTQEILEKNGFVKSVPPPGIHARKCYTLDNPEEKYVLYISDYNKYKRLLLNIDSADSECFNIKCDYVHELQHAIKLCHIEKTIEL